MLFVKALFAVVLFFLAVILIVLVLIQRGRGGGLAGAFGGMGGQSAFGTKAGDLFTRITIGVAAVWIVLCMLSIKILAGASSRIHFEGPVQSAPDSGSRQGGPAEEPAPAPSK